MFMMGDDEEVLKLLITNSIQKYEAKNIYVTLQLRGKKNPLEKI